MILEERRIADLFKNFRALRPEEKQLLEKAFNLLEKEKKHIVAETSEDIETHVLEVSKISIEEVGLGVTSVLAIIVFHLIKVYNDEDYFNLEQDFDKQIALIVRGLVKISRYTPGESASQAEDFRKLILSLAVDVRVILIRLAEQLHKMRMLKYVDRKMQLKVSHESFFLYAPLAHRLGLYKLKSELEDLALKYTEPETYYDIAQRLQETAAERNRFIKSFIDPIKKRLNEEGIHYEIKGRPKSIHSIWNKMVKNNISFDEVYDKFAIRIIIDPDNENEKSLCWRVYSVVTENYQPNPKRLRDWISVPKTNGYESLHTTVVVPGGKWVEVQIRTVRMDEVAEKGYAAHWKYKENQNESSGLDDWLGKVREILEHPEPDAINFIDDFKLALYSKEIFIFTPKGDLKKFPKGATVLDFAFDIHSEIGAMCMGAMVNGRNVPLRYQLKNGDKVEIITSKNQRPKLDWLNIVVTSKAKSKIKQTLNEAKLKDAEVGKDLIKRRFKNWKINYEDTNINKLLKHFGFKNSQDFYYEVANEKVNLTEVKDLLLNTQDESPADDQKKTAETDGYVERYHSDDTLIIDEKIANVDYKLARCCNPIYGDEIFGFVTIGEGIKIHRVNCPNATQLLGKYNYRVVKAKWKASETGSSYVASVRINGYDELGLFNRISEIIGNDPNMSLRSFNIESNDGMFDGKLRVTVRDRSHLDTLLHRLTQIKGVMRAIRTDV